MRPEIEQFLNNLQYNKGRSPRTIHKYRGFLNRLEAWAKEQGADLLDVTREQLEQFSGMVAHEQGLTPRARIPLVAALRGFFQFAAKEKLVKTNPAEELPYPKVGQKLPVPLELQEAGKLIMAPGLETLAGLRDTCILMLFAGTGMRIGGLSALNEGNLVFTKVEGQEWLIIRVLEKGGKERLLPVPHEARLILRAYLAHPELKQIDRTLPNGEKVLFVSTRNRNVKEHEYHGEARRLSETSIRDMFVKYAKQAGLPRNKAHPHALRHLYGTELAEHDVQDAIKQMLLGHADANTSAIYTHLAMRKLTKEIARANPLSSIKTPTSDIAKELASRGK